MRRKRKVNLGKNIKIARIQKDLNQVELAKKVGITSNYMSLIESGVKTPSFKVLIKICDILEVDIGTLTQNDPVFSELRELARKYDLQNIIKQLQKLIGD